MGARRERNGRPVRERVRSRSRNTQSVFASEADHFRTKARHLLTRDFNVRADRRTDFDDRIVQFALHLFFKARLARFEHLRDVRFQLARLRIDYLEILLRYRS